MLKDIGEEERQMPNYDSSEEEMDKMIQDLREFDEETRKRMEEEYCWKMKKVRESRAYIQIRMGEICLN